MTTYDNLDEATDTQQYLFQGNPADLQGDWRRKRRQPPPRRSTPATCCWHGPIARMTTSAGSTRRSSTGSTRRIAARWFPIPGMMPTATPSRPRPAARRSSPRPATMGSIEPTVVYVGFDPSGDPSTDASAASVAGDIILEQTDTQYDAAGDTTLVTTYDRYDDASTGDHRGLGCAPRHRKRLPRFLRSLLVRRHRPRDGRAEFRRDGQPAHARPGRRPARRPTAPARRRSA